MQAGVLEVWILYELRGLLLKKWNRRCTPMPADKNLRAKHGSIGVNLRASAVPMFWS